MDTCRQRSRAKYWRHKGELKATLVFLYKQHADNMIEVTYHSFGPGATFEYLHKISPAIPILRGVQRHMESEFETLTRGACHGTPDEEADVARLTEQYMKSLIHVYTPGRQLWGGKNQVGDYVSEGAINLERLGTLDTWWSTHSFARATTEVWDNTTSAGSGSGSIF